MNVLVLSSIFPLKEIPAKVDENDIILVTNDALKEKVPSYHFVYGFPVLYVNRVLSYLSPKWKGYYILKKKKKTSSVNGNSIHVFPVFRISRYPLIGRLLMDFHFFLCSGRYGKFLKENKIELIHAHSVASDGYLAYKLYKKFKIPYILTVRELNKGNQEDRVITNSSGLICLNGVDKNLVKSKYHREAELIPHGLVQEFFHEKKEYNTSGKLRLLSVCRLIALKNLDQVILSLKDSGIDFIYDIYGDGVEYKNLKNLIKQYGLENKITLKGKIPYNEIQSLYTSYDLFIMPSYPEALGRVYFESMASATPVVACKGTGLDGFIEDYKDGFLIDRTNICSELTNVLVHIDKERHLLKNISENSRKIADQYKWEEVLQKIHNVYQAQQ